MPWTLCSCTETIYCRNTRYESSSSRPDWKYSPIKWSWIIPANTFTLNSHWYEWRRVTRGFLYAQLYALHVLNVPSQLKLNSLVIRTWAAMSGCVYYYSMCYREKSIRDWMRERREHAFHGRVEGLQLLARAKQSSGWHFLRCMQPCSSPVATRIHATNGRQVRLSSHSWYVQCRASRWQMNLFLWDADASFRKFFGLASVLQIITPLTVANPLGHIQLCKWNAYQAFSDSGSWPSLQSSKKKTIWMRTSSGFIAFPITAPYGNYIFLYDTWLAIWWHGPLLRND